MIRSTLGLPFQWLAIVGIKLSWNNPKLYPAWFKLYREALVYRGVRGEQLRDALMRYTP